MPPRWGLFLIGALQLLVQYHGAITLQSNLGGYVSTPGGSKFELVPPPRQGGLRARLPLSRNGGRNQHCQRSRRVLERRRLNLYRKRMMVRLISLWSRWFTFTLALVSIACLATDDGYGQRRPADHHVDCQLTSGGESTVMSVVGPQTLHLADGQFVRLTEVLTPAAAPGTGFDPSAAATAYLRSKTLGRKVEIRFGGNPRDRYGVATAHVFVAGEPALWLQEGLVVSGLALAFPQADNSACSRRLAALEVEARNEKRGHWGLAMFKVLPAKEARAINNLIQTYQIVEGRVDHITRAGSRALIHFGEENKFGFTALVEPAAQKGLAENVELLSGRTILIRGWIEHKRGPSVTIVQPEQIELVDEPNPSTKAQ